MSDEFRPEPGTLVTFGVFELDVDTGELRKGGRRVRLAGQPLRVLERLVDRPGELVTREELRQQLWSGDTIVDFERNLNSAVKRLRAALGDSAETPRFVETLPRRGYRFLAPVTRRHDSPAGTGPHPSASVGSPIEEVEGPARGYGRWLLMSALVVAVVATVAAVTWPDRPHRVRAIAVLPFVLADATSTEDEYLAFGLSEALIGELTKLGGPRVISQTSSLLYRSARKPLPQIARELRVDAVVEGSLQREGNRIRITVQLIEAESDSHLWSESYEREMGSILPLVKEVARAVARQIHVQVSPADPPPMARLAVDPRISQEYLKGRYYLGKGTEADTLRATGHFERALALDPSHALSHAGLADYYVVNDTLPPAVVFEKARFHALKALELDETLPDAHASLAFLHYYDTWDWAAAEREFRRAIELDPGHARAHRWYALFLSAMGRHTEALDRSQTAVAADPIAIANHDAAATVRFNARQYGEAAAIGRDIHDLDAFDPRGYEHMAAGLMQQRRPADALAEVEKGLELAPNIALELTRVVCLGRLGRTAEADQALGAFERRAQGRHVPKVVLAVAYAELGRLTQAIDRLEQAYDEHDPYLVLINVSPWFDSLRGEERFQRLRDRLRFP